MTVHTLFRPSALIIWQQRISIFTWLVIFALSLRGLFVFYGMKDKSSIEQMLTTVTEPLVQLFSFKQIENIGIPAVSILFAAVSFLLLSLIVQLGLWYANERRHLARYYAFHHAVTVRTK